MQGLHDVLEVQSHEYAKAQLPLAVSRNVVSFCQDPNIMSLTFTHKSEEGEHFRSHFSEGQQSSHDSTTLGLQRHMPPFLCRPTSSVTTTTGMDMSCVAASTASVRDLR